MNKSRGPEPVVIQLSPRQQSILEEIVHCRHSPQYEVLRAKVILEASLNRRNRHIADKLGIKRDTVRLWRTRWANATKQLDEIEVEKDDRELRSFIQGVLDDAPRSGCPGTFTPEQICQIVALACKATEDSDRPVSEWTSRELADEVIKRGIVSSISVRSVGRFLKSGGFKAPQIPLLAKQPKRKRS